MKGILWVTSGPSGAGKTTLLYQLIKDNPNCIFSVSATTRPKRENEKDGVDYFFIDREKFTQMIEAGEFLEWAEVHGNFYGTPKKFVYDNLEKGIDVILDIDVQGGLQVKKLNLPEAVMIFIAPPSLPELTRRLKERNTEQEDKIKERINTARWELNQIAQYEYLVINDNLELALQQLKTILKAERLKSKNYCSLSF